MSATRSHGFTLIELMVTVIILSIIVAIAYPAYTSYTTQTRRSDAQVALMQTTQRLEKYFSTCNQYPSAAGAAAITNPWPGNLTANQCPPDDGTQGIGQTDANSQEGHYTLAVDTTAATCGTPPGAGGCFVVTATPAGLQVGDGALRIDSTGLKEWDKKDDGSFDAKWTDK